MHFDAYRSETIEEPAGPFLLLVAVAIIVTATLLLGAKWRTTAGHAFGPLLLLVAATILFGPPPLGDVNRAGS